MLKLTYEGENDNCLEARHGRGARAKMCGVGTIYPRKVAAVEWGVLFQSDTRFRMRISYMRLNQVGRWYSDAST